MRPEPTVGGDFRRRWLPLAGGAVFLCCLWGYFELAEDYPEGRYRVFDETLLRALRSPIDPAIPHGPHWLVDVIRGVSALGGPAALTISVLGLVGWLVAQGRRPIAWSVALAAGGGALLAAALKALAGRPRPEIVPHLTEVASSSFPSGHSMLSAVVYLSVSAMIAYTSPKKTTAIGALLVAGMLTVAIGCTRVYLGVHYPSDVLAGWVAGVAWTLLCVAVCACKKKPPAR